MRPDGVWRKSTHSAGSGNCVEVAGRRGLVVVRDSKDPRGPVLRFEPTTWQSFIGSIAASD